MKNKEQNHNCNVNKYNCFLSGIHIFQLLLNDGLKYNNYQTILILLVMPFKLPQQLYRWMLSLDIIPNDAKKAENNKMQLSNSLSIQIQNGIVIGKIIKNIIKSNKQSVPTTLENMKQGNTSPSKISNWNVIWNCFSILRMEFDPQIKQFIIAGDNDMIIQVIKQLYQKYAPQILKIQSQQIPKGTTKEKKTFKNEKDNKDNKKSIQKAKNQSVDITKLDIKKNPSQANSSLEFLILLLCQNLGLPMTEVLGLFTNQNKYLAHVIAKGMKGQFYQVISFYQGVLKNINKFKQLIQQDPKSINFTLYALKPGFISKSDEVALKTIQIFFELQVYNWFIGEGKGLLTLILGLKRHPHLVQNYAKLLIYITRDNFSQFITRFYKSQFQDVNQLLFVTSELLKTFTESQICSQLENSGVINQWIELALQNLQTEGRDKIALRVSCLKFITKLWQNIPEYIDEDQDVVNRFLDYFKKQWKSKTFDQFLTTCIEVFNLMVLLAQLKNPSAKLVYNTICSMLTQILNSQDHRSFILVNFIQICKKFPTIPLNFLIETFSAIESLQICDIEFLLNISQLPGLDLKSALIIGELSVKFFQQSVVNAILSNVILKIIGKFQKQIVEFASKTVKSLLALLFASEKNKKPFQKKGPLYFNRKGTTPKINSDDMQSQMISAQQRSLIIQLIKKIIMINCTDINNKIKSYIVGTSVQIKQFNKSGNKGINGLLTLFGIPKDLQESYIQENKQKKISDSSKNFNQIELKEQRFKMNSKASVPDHIIKHLQKLEQTNIEKKKKIELQNLMKNQQQQKKKQNVKKEIQKIKFLRGFGGEAQLMEDGYWERKTQKKQKQLQIIDSDVLQQKDIEFIDIILKKYHKVLRQLFLKYTATGFTTKKDLNFDQLGQRSQTISLIQILKMLKDYKLYFLTDLAEIQTLIREVNLKLLKKRQTQQFDFGGFEQYIVQFALLIYSKSHTINLKIDGKIISQKREMKNMMPAHILENFFKYLKNVFQQKGETTVLFDDPDAVYFNQSEIIKQFNKKLDTDPNFILPEGYKKVVQKNMTFQPKIQRTSYKNIRQSYFDCLQILDQIIFDNLKFHLIEPIGIKSTKAKARPSIFINAPSKLLEKPQRYSLASEYSSKNRMISSAHEQKKSIHIPLQKNFSFGIKLGLSYLTGKDKLIGEQIGCVLQDILNAVEKGKTVIQPEKSKIIVNEVMKIKQKQEQQEKKLQQQRDKKRNERKLQLQQMKKEHNEKKIKQQAQKKQSLEKKKKQQQQKEKKKKEQKQKQVKEIKQKIETKKKQQEEKQKKKLEDEKNKKKIEEELQKKKFNEFNQNQITKLQQELKVKHSLEEQKKKKAEQQTKLKNQKFQKLKEKIHQQDQKIKYIQQKTNEQISQLYNSSKVQQIFKKFETPLKNLFDLLIKYTYTSITQKKHNNEIINQTWFFFNSAFKLTPLILNGKQISLIFNSLTRNKLQTKDFKIGLNYTQFCQALLRAAIKHKTLFNKIASKIKDGNLTGQQMNQMAKSEQKNEFEQQKDVDVNNLLKEDIVNNKILDNYGDISKADENTIKALLYYLKLPQDKVQLEGRFKIALEQKNKRSKTNKEELKQKLNEDYTRIQIRRNSKSKLSNNEKSIQKNQSINSINRTNQLIQKNNESLFLNQNVENKNN